MTPDDTLRLRLQSALEVSREMDEALGGVKTWLQLAQDAAWDRPHIRRNGYVDVTRLLGVLDALSGARVSHDLHHLILRLYPEDDQEREDKEREDQEWGDRR